MYSSDNHKNSGARLLGNDNWGGLVVNVGLNSNTNLSGYEMKIHRLSSSGMLRPILYYR